MYKSACFYTYFIPPFIIPSFYNKGLSHIIESTFSYLIPALLSEHYLFSLLLLRYFCFSPSLLFLSHCFFFFLNLVLAALGLHCCVRAFFSCSEQILLFIAVLGLLIVMACCRAQSLGTQASFLHSTWESSQTRD